MLRIWIHFWLLSWIGFGIVVAGGSRSSDPNVQISGEPIMDPSSFPDVPMGNVDTMENDIPGRPLGPLDFKNAAQMSHPSLDTKHQADPIELAGLYQGDIVLNNDTDKEHAAKAGKGLPIFRNGMIDLQKRWDNGIIPYVISSTYNNVERGTIAMAIKEYHKNTCIRLIPRTVERDYIHVLKGDGCSSSVGRQGGAQKVSLGPGCLWVGIVMHELMHAAGFWHEQSRNDRDNFITINKLNIQDGMWYNFEKYSWDKIQSFGVGYDLGSVMHYGPYAFAKHRTKPTIIPRITGAEIGQRRGFSKKDILKLQKMYNCANTTEEFVIDTPEPSITTLSPDVCEDTNKYCETWAVESECETNPKWMGINCKKSCRLCGDPCHDSSEYCALWAKGGECLTNPDYMDVACMFSCDKCVLEQEDTTICDDLHRYCRPWADSGECHKNPRFMLLYCRKSCKDCRSPASLDSNKSIQRL